MSVSLCEGWVSIVGQAVRGLPRGNLRVILSGGRVCEWR